MVQFLLKLDSNILLWIQDVVRTPIGNPIFIFFTTLGNMGAVWGLISLLLLIPKKTRRIGVMALVSLVLFVLVNNLILKNLVGRARPYEVMTNLQLLVDKAKDYSFPSGHAGSSFAVAYILYKELPKKYGFPAMILAGLIAFSRLYVGIHYPSDVVAGIVLGIVVAVLVCKVFYMKAPNEAVIMKG